MKMFRKILKLFRKTLKHFRKILKAFRKTLKMFLKILKMFHKKLRIFCKTLRKSCETLKMFCKILKTFSHLYSISWLFTITVMVWSWNLPQIYLQSRGPIGSLCRKALLYSTYPERFRVSSRMLKSSSNSTLL